MSFGPITVPLSTRKPGQYVGIDASGARSGSPAADLSILLVGYRADGQGTAPDLEAQQITSSLQGASLFGEGSELDLMIRAATDVSTALRLNAIAVPITGAAASQTFTFAGESTAAGEAVISIAGQRVAVAIPSGTVAAVAGPLLNAAINARPRLPVTSEAIDAIVTATYKSDGVTGNQCKVKVLSAPAGLTLTAGAATLTGGTGAISIDEAGELLEVIAPFEYNYIAMASNEEAALQDLRDQLEELSGAASMKNQQGFAAFTGTRANAKTLSGNLNAALIEILHDASCEDLPCEYAAAAAARRFVERGVSTFLPLNGVFLTGRSAPVIPMLDTEIEDCLANGLTPMGVGAGNRCQIIRSITTYTTDAADNPDPTLLDTLTIDQAYEVRRVIKISLGKFARGLVTDAVLGSIKSDVYARLLDLEARQIVERVEEFVDDIVVTRDPQVAGRVNIDIPANIVSGLYVIDAQIRIRQLLS